MEKAIYANDLIKTFKGLVGHFNKAASLHKAQAGHHEEIAKVHAEHAAFHKGRADAADDGDAMKAVHDQHAAFHKAKADFHKGLHALHKAHADHCAEMADAYDVGDKAAGANEPGAAAASAAAIVGKAADGTTAATVIEGADFGGFMKSSLVEAFGELSKGDDFKSMIKAFVFEQAKKALKDTVIPTNVSAIAPPDPKDLEKRGLQAVRRPGAPGVDDVKTLEEEADELDPELRKAIV